MKTLKTLLDIGFDSQWFTGGPVMRQKFRQKYLITGNQDEKIGFIESVLTLVYDMRRSTSIHAVVISFGSFFRSVTGKSVTGSLVTLFEKLAHKLSGHVSWAQNSSWIDIMDDLHKNLHRVRDSALGRKVIEVLNHVIAHTFYHKMGVEIDNAIFAKIEKGYIRPTVWSVATFADAIIGLLLFLAKAGRQALATGSIEPFFVDSVVVSDWLLKANRLRKDAEFLGNPTAVGIAIPEYLRQIEETIDEGNMLRKAFGEAQKLLINGVIVELELVQKRHLVSLASSSFRFCPFGVNLWGDSGVGKSFLAKGLFDHYCSVRGISKERAVLYPRNPDDKYYSGFKSSMPGIIFDDVAKHRSNKVLGIDQSLSDIISVGNNIPMITNQADLHDKGKIPLLCEWFGITSNIENLSVSDYYLNTYAVLRRMPYRIEPIVKPAYRKQGKMDLDPSKVPEGEYPDCWTFEVCEVVRHGSSLTGSYQNKGCGRTFSCYADLLRWLTGVYEDHISNQQRLMDAVQRMGPQPLCKCLLPKSICDCRGEATAIAPGAELPAPAIEVGEPIRVQDLAGNDLFDDDELHFEAPVLVAQSACKEQLELLFEEKRMIQTRLLTPGLETRFRTKWLIEQFPNIMVGVVNGDRKIRRGEVIKDFEMHLQQFLDLPLREQGFRMLASHGQVTSDESYLTFMPSTAGPSTYFRDQLRRVQQMLQPYIVPLQWNEAQLSALEMYLYDRVPGYLAQGWDDKSLYLGALDYVAYYASEFEDRDDATREFMLSDAHDQPTLSQAICQWFGYQYFSRPWLFRMINYCAQLPGVRSIAAHISGGKSFQFALLKGGADAFDFLTGGTNPAVLLLVAMCSIAAIATLIRVATRRYMPQFSLHTEGREPVVREEEKKNPWHMKERQICALDFHPRRPNNRSQLDSLLARNVLHATIAAQDENGKFKCTTTCIVVDSSTIVLNTHAVFLPMTLTLYMGRRRKEGVEATVTIDVCAGMVEHLTDRDISIIKTSGLPALFSSIAHCFPRKTYKFDGPCQYYIVRESTEFTTDVIGTRTVRTRIPLSVHSVLSGNAITGKPKVMTEFGDCGSPLIQTTRFGPVVVGIHCAADLDSGTTFASPLFFEDFPSLDKFSVAPTAVKPAVVVAQVSTESTTSSLRDTDKLFTDFHERGVVMTMGQLKGFRPRFKATGGYSLIGKSVLSSERGKALGVTDRLFQPVMSGWEPQQVALKEFLHHTHSINEPLFRVCVDSFAEHIGDGLTEEDKVDSAPVTLDVAVNGYPGVPNVDAQKFTTAAGHGMPGPKRAYIASEDAFSVWEKRRVYTPELEAKVKEILDKAERGKRSHPIFTAHLKDEMVSAKKVAAKKTRVFFMCPVDFLTANRMFTMGLTRVMVRRRKLFRIAVGLNTHSEEWDDLFREAMKILGDCWLAGDFVGFDKILSLLIQNGGRDVLIRFAQYCGWSDRALLILHTMLDDTISPAVDFFGELLVLLGGEVSGHQLTTFFNCICNVLLHLYAWVILSVERGEEPRAAARRFWTLVFICVLGDDIMAKVHEAESWYNHTTVQRVFASIGITYTMADKTSESRPYISWSEVTFLKRRFATHPDLPGVMVAPLEKESIFKMLVYSTPSKSVSLEEQTVMACTAALSEAFYHGREFFDAVESLIREADKSEELQSRFEQKPPPSYTECWSRFVKASPRYRVSAGLPECHDTEEPLTTDSYCHFPNAAAQAKWSVDPWGSTTMGRSPEELYEAGIRLSPKQQRKPRRDEKGVVVENCFLSKNTKINTNNHTSEEHGYMAPSSAEQAIGKMWNKRRRRVRTLRWKGVVPQSNILPDTTGNVSMTQELYTFQAEPEHVTIDIAGRKNLTATRQTIASSLAQYMERPELVHRQTWAEGDPPGVLSSVNVWQLAMTPAKREKLSGFGLFRGNLCIKFVINGTSFLYGGLAAVYTPLSGWRTDTGSYAASASLQLITASQKPHVWLNVQDASTAQMKVPFLFPYPHMNTNLLSNFGKLGKIDYTIFVKLASANGVPGNVVDVQMYTWFEDVELTGPTNLPVAQSQKEYESDHQISGPASAVAAGASMLKNVPIIGPYAMATEKAASLVSTVANALGYTNVPNVSDIAPMRPRPFNLAPTDLSEPIEKLSLTSKQEVALDMSSYGGTDTDELVIKRFAGRESFLCATSWTTALTPDAPLFTAGVSPLYFDTHPAGGAYALTPLAYCSYPFQYWRGSIKFTFKAIRSKYHRGRVQISWDRSAGNLASGPVLGNANTMSTVLDLDEGDEVSMVVPYQQQSLFLPVPKDYIDSAATVGAPVNWSISSTPTGASTLWNGVLNMRVLTRLTAPESSTDITFLVFVSAGDDFELAAPAVPRTSTQTTVLTMSNTATTVAQSAIEYQLNAPDATADPSTVADVVYMDVFGEKVASLRGLMHRYSRVTVITDSPALAPSNESISVRRIPLKHMPPAQGFWNNAEYITSTPVNSRITLASFHPMTWFTYCFAGYRGSVNVAVNALNSGQMYNSGYIDSMSISRVPYGNELSTTSRRSFQFAVSMAGTGSASSVASLLQASRLSTGFTGSTLTNTRTNASVMANLPYYSSSAFYIADPYTTYNNQDTLSDANNDWWSLEAAYAVAAAQITEPAFDIYYASGPDFNVAFYVCTPILYRYTYVV